MRGLTSFTLHASWEPHSPLPVSGSSQREESQGSGGPGRRGEMGRLLVPCCPERALELPGRVSLLQINYCSVLVSSVADVLAQGGGPWSKPVWGAWDEGGHGHPLCSGWWEQLGGCRLCCVLCLPCLAWESQETLAGHGSSGWCGCPLMEPCLGQGRMWFTQTLEALPGVGPIGLSCSASKRAPRPHGGCFPSPRSAGGGLVVSGLPIFPRLACGDSL